ncbi:MAG: N5-glutamine methyltransferase family protein [Subdoligranulum sp.]
MRRNWLPGHWHPPFCAKCQRDLRGKSPQAPQYLQANVHGTGVQAKAADVLQYWQELVPQSVQLIISNPPYLTGAEMQALMPETAHEPAMALDGGTDGLDFYRAIAAHYRDIVCPGGWLVFEIGCAQRADVMEICRQNGWQQVQARKDYGGNDRVVYAQRVKYI